MTRRRRTAAARTSGFTLIEMLVVVAIIGLLIGLVTVALAGQSETGRITDCRARIVGLAQLIESYADRMGDYPPSRLGALGLKGANADNEGIEACVAALRSGAYTGRRPEEAWLGNTDGDANAGLKSADGSTALLELLDPWDNPLIYIGNADYGHEFSYRLASGDVRVRAALNATTGAPHQFEGFQLLSAGPDGELGTDDDLANYEIGDAPR